MFGKLEWMEIVEQMKNPTDEQIFECLGVAKLFGTSIEPSTRNDRAFSLCHMSDDSARRLSR